MLGESINIWFLSHRHFTLNVKELAMLLTVDGHTI